MNARRRLEARWRSEPRTPFSSRLLGAARLGLFIAWSGAGCAAPSPHSAHDASRAVHNQPASFELEGKAFCFVGANNYYLGYAPRPMVDDVLESAQEMGVKVVRTWGFIDRGSLDGSVRSVDGDGTKRGFYFQAWDPLAQRAIFNDGPNGLPGLDYALAKAGQMGLKLVVVLTNNWQQFGGMDQYLAWFGLSAHVDFYRDPRVRQAYRAYLEHVVLRVNGITNRVYREDPTILSWELANEPRGSSGTPSSVVTSWASEMSTYLKSLDPNHLVAVGDEGFLEGDSEHWTYHADNGIDHRALTALPNVDYGTYHLYPEAWGTGFGWSERWLDDHVRVARELGKPSVLEEYGLTVTRDELGRVRDRLAFRLESYRAWNERVLARGGNAAMFWLLVGRDSERGGVYPDYDGFSVYRGDPTAELLTRYARRFSREAPACAPTGTVASGSRSPFVRVRRSTASAPMQATSG